MGCMSASLIDEAVVVVKRDGRDAKRDMVRGNGLLKRRARRVATSE